MNLFTVLLKKEVKELLTRQLLVSIAAMLFIFTVIGKTVGSSTRSSGARSSVVVLDLDRSALSKVITGGMEKVKTEVKFSPAADIAGALASADYAGENSFVLIPAGLEKDVDSGKASRVEYYSRFRKDASGLGPALAAGRIKKVSALVSGEISAYLLNKRLPK